ncbi:MAG: transporter [Chitinophagaceae bacterium]
MKKILLTVLPLLVFTLLWGQQKDRIETDRPNETEVPYTVPKKFFQIEAGVYHEKTSQAREITNHPHLLLKYGLSKQLELRVQANLSTVKDLYFQKHRTTTGLEPLELGIKGVLWGEMSWVPRTSLLLQTGIPTLASGDFKGEHFAPEIRLLMENDISDAFSLNYNVGAEWDGEQKNPTWLYTFSPGLDIGKRWHAFAEIFGFFNKHEEANHTLDGGIEYFVNKNFAVDVCSGFGLNKGAPHFFITAGGSVRFK